MAAAVNSGVYMYQRPKSSQVRPPTMPSHGCPLGQSCSPHGGLQLLAALWCGCMHGAGRRASLLGAVVEMISSLCTHCNRLRNRQHGCWQLALPCPALPMPASPVRDACSRSSSRFLVLWDRLASMPERECRKLLPAGKSKLPPSAGARGGGGTVDAYRPHVLQCTSTTCTAEQSQQPRQPRAG